MFENHKSPRHKRSCYGYYNTHGMPRAPEYLLHRASHHSCQACMVSVLSCMERPRPIPTHNSLPLTEGIQSSSQEWEHLAPPRTMWSTPLTGCVIAWGDAGSVINSRTILCQWLALEAWQIRSQPNPSTRSVEISLGQPPNHTLSGGPRWSMHMSQYNYYTHYKLSYNFRFHYLV